MFRMGPPDIEAFGGLKRKKYQQDISVDAKSGCRYCGSTGGYFCWPGCSVGGHSRPGCISCSCCLTPLDVCVMTSSLHHRPSGTTTG